MVVAAALRGLLVGLAVAVAEDAKLGVEVEEEQGVLFVVEKKSVNQFSRKLLSEGLQRS